ncbi:hypothetical protein FBZ90_102453 [Nitrospirillum pindoramense]|uniref:Uncharacterized protein n=1 Tax=Nitrospirillum amazonense TaxID=28077 RepID=A0A560HGC2_9PROT|nr:hypothetical protein FBZ90_102453 [Nitrospirillum amazonense]
MPVNYQFKVSSSNKVIIPLGEYAYHKPGLWVVCRPKIDKITLTVKDLDPDLQNLVQANLIAAEDEKGPYTSAPVSKKAPYYQTRALLTHEPSGQNALIEAKPKLPGAAFLRMEFNPHKLGKAGISFVYSHLLALLSGAYFLHELLPKVRVTRLDIAVDLIDVPIQDVHVTYGNGGKTLAYFSSVGQLETLYVGKKKSGPAPGYIYDKKQQLLDNGQPLVFKNVSHARVELHVKSSRPLVKLGTLKNPLNKLTVQWPLAGPSLDLTPHHWSHFLDSVRLRGLQAALSLISDGVTRENYAIGFKKGCEENHIWDAQKLWGMWGEVVHGSGLLP